MIKTIFNKDLKHSRNPINIVNKINRYINENDCPNLSMDISHFNVLDASKIAILCSTYHWAKYPDGKINLITNSTEIKELVRPMNLGNIELVMAHR